MSDSSIQSTASTPRLSAYPPAFVSLITTFIQQAEDAEMRAHKALVILQAKDLQVHQLQERMDTLEKLASRLEEVIVPPLELPQSAPSTLAEDSPHPRDHVPLETLYERVQPPKQDPESDLGHNCYLRCQHLIDGLERSNQQLREALTSESTLRVRDHEQYVETIVQVTEAVKQWQSCEQKQKPGPKQALQTSEDQPVGVDTLGAGDTQGNSRPRDTNLTSREGGDMAVLDRKDLKKSLEKAERIIINLKQRFENNGRQPNYKSTLNVKKCSGVFSSRSSTSSYHTPVSSISLKVRSKSKHKSLNRFYSSLKRKNTKLRLKYEHMGQKFKECLNVCERLQRDVVKLNRNSSKVLQSSTNCAAVSTQTDKATDGLYKSLSGRTTNILQGRLDAAAKVMAKQCKHIESLQKQLNESLSSNEALKKRLSRAETAVTGKDVLAENSKREIDILENKNSLLTQEITNLTNVTNRLKQDLSALTEAKISSEQQRAASDQQLEEMKLTMESKLTSLSQALQEREDMSEKAAEELETKLTSLRTQFISHVTVARDRLTTANDKIHELYSGIEMFLKMLFNNGRPLTPLSPESQAEAVQKASDILQLAPGQVQDILVSSRQENLAVTRWLKELNHLVRTNNFSNPLAHVLLSAVTECYRYR